MSIMMSGYVNNDNYLDSYADLIQGQVLFNDSQLPKVVWNQIKILIISNQNGRRKQKLAK